MSDSTTSPEAAVAHEADDHGDEAHAHPSDMRYVQIAVVLAAITAVEVFTYFKSVLDWGDWLIPSLLVMMAVKFFLVAAFFMHLRQDSILFSRLFVGGLTLASGVYIIALNAFEFWG